MNSFSSISSLSDLGAGSLQQAFEGIQISPLAKSSGCLLANEDLLSPYADLDIQALFDTFIESGSEEQPNDPPSPTASSDEGSSTISTEPDTLDLPAAHDLFAPVSKYNSSSTLKVRQMIIFPP